MSKLRISIALAALLVLSLIRTASAQTQFQSGGWSEPYRLSSDAGTSSEGYLVADQYGYVHCFWTETLYSNGKTVIRYARFDGTTWTKPNDVYVSDLDIRNVSPSIDRHGILHIVWSESQLGIPYYSHAPVNEALSAQSWSKPIRLNVSARPIFLKVDSKDVLHVLFINPFDESSGVYYTRSENGGYTWSDPYWLDPDIKPNTVPDSLSFVLDENDGLHASWFYGSREARGTPDWVRYTHSLDGGHTWSEPFTIDRRDESSDHNLTDASPIMTVQGHTVHVIWAAGTLPYRYHRYSTDNGLTWSPAVQIFGELHGQAFDGLAVDDAGRVHFFGQIRYPMGIYHAYWDQNRWSTPSLVYLIAAEGTEADFTTRVHAHHTLPIVRAGNQLVLTFADGPADPNRRLFVTFLTLDDTPPLESMPTPQPTATIAAVSSPTPTLDLRPQLTMTALALSSAQTPPLESSPEPDIAIRAAVIPTLVVLGVLMVLQMRNKRRH